MEASQQRKLYTCWGSGFDGEHHRPDDRNIHIQQAVSTKHWCSVGTKLTQSGLFEQIECIPEEERVCRPAIAALASEGTKLDHRISTWYDDISLQLDPVDPFTQLALANHYAVRLFHCKNFTYYTCWQAGTVPELDQPEIDTCVAAITCFCDQILQTSNIPGVVLLFPLRMAGAHSNVEWQRDKIRNLLHQVCSKGFVVAERIKTDLGEFWQYQDDQDLIKISV